MKVCDCLSCPCKAVYQCYKLQCYCCKVPYVHKRELSRLVSPCGAIFFGVIGTPPDVGLVVEVDEFGKRGASCAGSHGETLARDVEREREGLRLGKL